MIKKRILKEKKKKYKTITKKKTNEKREKNYKRKINKRV